MTAEAPACSLAGIFLTHAHIGHYTGLVHLGREAMGTHGMPVWVMPRMRDFLTANGPWGQLVTLANIELRPLAADSTIALGDSLRVTPFRVPHRDEYSETVGFRIDGPRGAVVYLPDIDKWERWDRRIEDVTAGASAAYLDGTFFDAAELPGRDLREIPHPFIVESLSRFATLPAAERKHVRFIHLNHTNRAGIAGTAERKRVEAAGCGVAAAGERTAL
jgi:pyrroloquinoline quinone biosynthesis protein B